MTKLVTIFGGSGFVGRYIARRMAKQGWRVRVAVRRPNEALFVRPYGVVGQVEPIFANIRDDASVQAAMAGADAVVNCVGVLAQQGRNTFDALQHQGAARIARLAAQAGIAKLVHISAIGADHNAESHYARSKAQGEDAMRAAFGDAVILRPSVIFGAEDEFFNRFAAMARTSPVLPVIGARTKFQPVYVDDVAQAAEKAIIGDVAPGIYELGGPEQYSFRDLMKVMLSVIKRNCVMINIPFGPAYLMAWGFDMMQAATFGLIRNPALTRDQWRNLKHDNVVSDDAQGFGALGITPTAMGPVLGEYLWPFRPDGQYADIKETAQHLRNQL
jgi:NADH dehydrogenase